jgi:flagellar hook assembly protein FlgD
VSNYPNPFNPTTTILYESPEEGPVDLLIYDASGRLTRTLLSEEVRRAGRHEVVWDGTDDLGREVGASVYFVLTRTRSGTASSKMVLLR